MPFILAAAVVGAGVYGLWRVVNAVVQSVEGARTPIEPKAPPFKDLGTFERDAKTGVYRTPDQPSA